jgi:hypothetical protein
MQLNRRRPILHPRMIATIAGTIAASVTITITLLLPSSSSKTLIEKAKGGTWRFPLLLTCCVVSEAR